MVRRILEAVAVIYLFGPIVILSHDKQGGERALNKVAMDVQRKVGATEKDGQLLRHYADETTSVQKWNITGMQLGVSIKRCVSITECDDLLEKWRLSPAQGIAERINGIADKAYVLRSSNNLTTLWFNYGIYVVMIEGLPWERTERISRLVKEAMQGK